MLPTFLGALLGCVIGVPLGALILGGLILLVDQLTEQAHRRELDSLGYGP